MNIFNIEYETKIPNDGWVDYVFNCDVTDEFYTEYNLNKEENPKEAFSIWYTVNDNGTPTFTLCNEGLDCFVILSQEVKDEVLKVFQTVKDGVKKNTKMIKVFRFEVSNWSSSCNDDDKNTNVFDIYQKRLVTEEDIEKTINKFLYGKTLIDIKINNVDVEYHNNGRGNTIHLIYTIIYEKP